MDIPIVPTLPGELVAMVWKSIADKLLDLLVFLVHVSMFAEVL